MTLETYTRALIARFAMSEGERHGGIRNMLGVAEVLRNRVMAGWGDWLEVVETAPAKRGTIYPESNPNLRTANFRTFLNRVDDIYTGTSTDDWTGGALFYAEPSAGIEPWFQAEILSRPDDHPRTAHIGPVWFFQ